MRKRLAPVNWLVLSLSAEIALTLTYWCWERRFEDNFSSSGTEFPKRDGDPSWGILPRFRLLCNRYSWRNPPGSRVIDSFKTQIAISDSVMLSAYLSNRFTITDQAGYPRETWSCLLPQYCMLDATLPSCLCHSLNIPPLQEDPFLDVQE